MASSIQYTGMQIEQVILNLAQIVAALQTVDADLTLKLQDREGKILLEDQGTRAGMELIERILDYF